jgi:hypothetical protein
LRAPAPADPSVLAVAIACVGGVLGAIFSFVSLWSASQARSRAEGAAFGFLRHRYPDVTAANVSRLVRSPAGFDAQIGSLRQLDPSQIQTPDHDGAALPPWTPDTVRPILPGPTQRILFSRARTVLYAGVFIAIVNGFARAQVHSLSPAIWFAGYVLAAIVVLVAVGIWIAALAKRRLEFLEGYSTAYPLRSRNGPTSGWDVHTSLDLVDGQSGYLLRAAGRRGLPNGKLAERLSVVRAAHPRARPELISGQ